MTPDQVTRLKDLEARRAVMVEYLKLKVREQDWHGVADAAMDLRDIDAEDKGVRSVS